MRSTERGFIFNVLLSWNPRGTGERVGRGSPDCGAGSLGIAFSLEGLLRPEDDLSVALPPTAGRAFIVIQTDSLHGCCHISPFPCSAHPAVSGKEERASGCLRRRHGQVPWASSVDAVIVPDSCSWGKRFFKRRPWTHPRHAKRRCLPSPICRKGPESDVSRNLSN